MARETKVGLLAGLAFIICFAIILANGGSQDLDRLAPLFFGERGATAQKRPSANTPARRQQPVQRHTDQYDRRPARRLQQRSSSDPTPWPGQPVHDDDGRSGARIAQAATPTPIVSLDRDDPTDPQTAGIHTALTASNGDDEGTVEYVTADEVRRLQQRINELTAQLQNRDPWRPQGVPQRVDGGGPARVMTSPERVDAGATERTMDAPPQPQSDPASPLPSSTEIHKVAPGDTLTRIAFQHYGSKSGSYVKAIFDANRRVLTDPNLLQVGMELVIPALARPARSADTTGAGDRDDRATTPVPADRTVPPASRRRIEQPPGFRWYQIKKNDRYVSIAREELGDGRRWREIYELNKDKFPDPELIREGVRIKLPPVALADSREMRH